MTKKKFEEIKAIAFEKVIDKKETFSADPYNTEQDIAICFEDDVFKVQSTKYGLTTDFAKYFDDFDSAFDYFVEEARERDIEIILY